MAFWKIIPGNTPYSQGIAIMEYHLKEVQTDPAKEIVLLMEHADVYTAGTSYDAKELLESGGIEVAYTGRGGKFTYHGPGQRIIYPIINLTKQGRKQDIRQYIQDLEQVTISTLKDLGIDAFLKDGLIGVWVCHNGQDKKIGAIGVRVQKWVAFHGIAINISTDLDKFKGIIPCGIHDYGVTSTQEIGRNFSMQDFDDAFMNNFERIFG